MQPTNPTIQGQFDSIWGSKVPAPGIPIKSAADEIRGLESPLLPQSPVHKNPLEQVGASITEGVAKPLATAEIGLGKDLQNRANKISDVFSEGMTKGKMYSPVEALDAGAKVAKEATGGITDTFGAGFKALTDIISNIPSLKQIASSKGVSAALDYVNNAGEQAGVEVQPAKDVLAKWSTENPQAFSILNSLAETGLNLSVLEGGPKATSILGKATNATVDATKTAITGAVDVAKSKIIAPLQDTAKAIATSQAEKAAAKSLDTIQETISPKITSKETQKMINDSRLTRGKESVVFGKQPDIITQSEAVQQAAKVINEQIPGASKMNDVQLATAIDSKTTELAKSLSKDMKAVPITLETTGKVVDTWKKLKAEQQSMPEFLDNKAGNEAFQSKFETRMKQLEWDITDASGKFKAPTQKTMDDIWEARKSYDDSIPSNVKNATEASSPVLQARKTMWLQNRSLMNAAINDTASGLGNTSRNAFENMSSMYDAKQNILSKAKVDLEGKKGILPSTYKGWITAGATLVGGSYVMHKLGI